MTLELTPLALFDVGTPELMLIFFAILLLFGGQKLPELAKGLGKSIREFKRASAGVEEEIRRAIDAAPEPSSTPRVLPATPSYETPGVTTVSPAPTTLPASTIENTSTLPAPSTLPDAPTPSPSSTVTPPPSDLHEGPKP
jgi:sec-independent protein translocase protein TatA